MAIPKKNIFVLGGGPAGLACAMYLLRTDIEADITVLESNSFVGGLASSFCEQGLYFDYGTHRLHPHSTPEVMQDIKDLMGDDLVLRPRNGRIGLDGNFIKFPLNPINLATGLSFGFSSSIVFDMITKQFIRKSKKNTYSGILLNGVGKTLCRKFYFPYARKIWGIEPDEIDATQAHRRVSANSITKTILKTFENIPGIKKKNSGIFYYPKKGYGQISDEMAREVERLGGKISLNSRVETIDTEENHIVINKGDRNERKTFDFLFSTIPIRVLTKLLHPKVPEDVKNASDNLTTRSVVLVFFILSMDRFTEFDAHYFPEERIIFSRFSEPKIYSDSNEPKNKTGLCFEIPCNYGDKIWSLDKLTLASLVLRDLRKYNFDLTGKIISVITKRVKDAYPIYKLDFESSFSIVDIFLNSQEKIISMGRQGLFAHDNLHHTVEMALCATRCLDTDLNWDDEKWQKHRMRFEKNVVVD